MYYKQLQQEEDRIMNLRIDNFIKAKYERDMKNMAEAQSIKAAKQKGIDHIAKAQKVINISNHTVRKCFVKRGLQT